MGDYNLKLAPVWIRVAVSRVNTLSTLWIFFPALCYEDQSAFLTLRTCSRNKRWDCVLKFFVKIQRPQRLLGKAIWFDFFFFSRIQLDVMVPPPKIIGTGRDFVSGELKDLVPPSKGTNIV